MGRSSARGVGQCMLHACFDVRVCRGDLSISQRTTTFACASTTHNRSFVDVGGARGVATDTRGRNQCCKEVTRLLASQIGKPSHRQWVAGTYACCALPILVGGYRSVDGRSGWR